MNQIIEVAESYSLADFQLNLAECISRLKLTRQPIELTVNGRSELVMLDTESFQKMIEAIDYNETVEAIRQGLAEVERGETIPAHQVLEEMRRKFNIPDKL
ncbi:MAG: hypothetical protein ACRD82_23365, partial [Blastocatellia bacterium]